MKKIVSFFFLALVVSTLAWAKDTTKRQFQGSGEVLEVEPLYSRVQIKHGPIPGLQGGVDNLFFVDSPELLKSIQKRDLVEFTVIEEKGDARLVAIKKTGEAPPKEENTEFGKAVQGVLTTTAGVAKAVTSPLPPANEVASGALDATTDATGSVLDEAQGPEVKTKF